MPPYGLLSTGFSPQPTTVIREELNAALKGEFGQSIDLTDYTLLGFIVGILAERYGKLWSLLEAVYSSQDPDKATGAALDALCALTGTFRTLAKASTVTLTLCGSPAANVTAGSRAAVEATGAEFSTDADAVIVMLDDWQTSNAYAVDDRVTNGGRCYVCITGGTSDGAGGPTTTDEDITDNTVHWRYLGEGTGAIDVAATCTVTGPTVAVSGDITEIRTPVSNWLSVRNLLDADLGSDIGSDEATRLQRGIDLAAPGTGTEAAIRQAVLAVEGVTSVRVFVNDTDDTDSDDVPAHGIEVLVEGGEDEAIAEAIFGSLSAGIATYGTAASVGVVDSQGTTQMISFSRPTPVPIYEIVNVIKDPATYPADGADQIKSAIVAYGDAQPCGKDAVASSSGAQAFRVAGVLDVTSTLIGTAPAPGTSVTVSISSRQRATWDTSRITVNTISGTP
jgi:uncharacterized phage protein gp47/JayE